VAGGPNGRHAGLLTSTLQWLVLRSYVPNTAKVISSLQIFKNCNAGVLVPISDSVVKAV
jgi:hypothetical protein